MLHGIGGRNPVALLAGGGVVVVLVVAIARRGSGSSSSGSTTQVPNTYDSTLSDIEAQWQNQFNDLQGKINNLQPPSGSPTQTGIWSGPAIRQGANPPRQYLPGGTPAMFPTWTSPGPLPAALSGPAINSVYSANRAATPAAASSAGFASTYVSSLRTGAKR